MCQLKPRTSKGGGMDAYVAFLDALEAKYAVG